MSIFFSGSLNIGKKPGLATAVTCIILSILFLVAGAYASAKDDSTDARFRAAFQDLSRLTGEVVSTKAQAKALCNREKYLADCAQIGKRHGLYKAERIKRVDVVLEEFKGKVVEDLKKCESAECLVGVAKDLAGRFAKSASEIAVEIDLTPQKIDEKKAIVEAAKEVGVDPISCRDMDPDTAGLDLLRSCARLAKHERVKPILPAEARRAADFNDASIRLEESLRRKEYQCGDNTAESCGNFCLNPGGTARAQGGSIIPPVCRAIAERFFGAEGVRHLEAAHKEVKETADFYAKRARHITFTTLEGKTLTDPIAIGRYLEDEGKKGNVEAVEKGLDFMVVKGFADSKDKEFVLGMVRKARELGGLPDFEACSQNVSLCENFIPDAQREEFKAIYDVERAIREEVGFDPRQCQENKGDEDLARRCIEGSKRALGKIEALGTKTPAIADVVSSIRRNVQKGEEAFSRKNEIRETFVQEGGPGGCTSEINCREYCSDPLHGPECIAFGAKHGIFDGKEAIKRFEEFNAVLVRPEQAGGVSDTVEFRGQGPFSDFQPPGRVDGVPPGQISAFREPGPGFGPPPGMGPSPECFAAIRSGDSVRAKEVCEVRFSGPLPPPVAPACPFMPPQPCAPGEYRLKERDEKGCAIAGACVPVPGYNPEAHKICPALPTVDECPAGTERVPSFSSPECGTYYRCVLKGAGGSGVVGSTLPSPTIASPPQPPIPICPEMPTIESCPAGQRKVPSFSSPECGTYYVCKPELVFSPPPYQSPYPSHSPYLKPYPSPTHAVSPLPHPTLYQGPYPYPLSSPVVSPTAEYSPRPTYSPQPIFSPVPIFSTQATYSPQTTYSPVPTYTPAPTTVYTPVPTQSFSPAYTPLPSGSPVSSAGTRRGNGFLANVAAAFNSLFRLFGQRFGR